MRHPGSRNSPRQPAQRRSRWGEIFQQSVGGAFIRDQDLGAGRKHWNQSLSNFAKRSNAYLEAGADVIFVEAPVFMEQVEALPKLIDGPLLYNWVFKGKSPLVPKEELLRLGYRYLFQADVLYAVSFALRHYFSELKATGSYGSCAERMISFDEFNALIGLDDIIAAEKKYEPPRP